MHDTLPKQREPSKKCHHSYHTVQFVVILSVARENKLKVSCLQLVFFLAPGAINQNGGPQSKAANFNSQLVTEFLVSFLNTLKIVGRRKSFFFLFKIFILLPPFILLPAAAALPAPYSYVTGFQYSKLTAQ